MNAHLTEAQAQQTQERLERVLYELKKVIVGQEHLLERLLLAVMVQGHVLVEGPPGLAKTLTLKSLAQVLSVDFSRIQFTPDLLPADLIGTRIYNPANGQFATEVGPLFANFVLADEINRAPAKVQSALLQAMQEQEITIGKETFALPRPFLVMATQNPIESEGTYALPEAQMDRFLFKLLVTYPSAREEMAILQRMGEATLPVLEPMLDAPALNAIQQQVGRVYLDPALMHTIVDVVQATRDPRCANIHYGASPRGALALTHAAKAMALFKGRNYATPDDVQALVHDCLRHRILLSYHGLTEGVTADKAIDEVLSTVQQPVPEPAPMGT